MSMERVYLAIRHSINSGEITSLSKEKLAEYAAALARSQAFTYFSASEFPQICETVRAALLLKSNEEASAKIQSQASSALAAMGDKAEGWYDRPIGRIGIGLIIAVLAFLAIYLMKTYVGIPS